MSTIGIVCAHYYEKYLAPTVRSLDRITSSLPVCGRVFVANHEGAWLGLNERLGDRDGSCDLIRHDNSGLEFGAYQVGVDRLLTLCDPDWILIVNDTFATHSNFPTAYRDRLRDELARPRSVPTIVGQVEQLTRSFELADTRIHRWITTNLFAVNRAALRALQGRLYRPEVEAMVVDDAPDMPGFFRTDVDPVLREHLEGWLFGACPGPRWYASEPLQPANAARMARKARSILQEKHLAAVLDRSGAEFIDLKQLSVSKKIMRAIEGKVFELARIG